MNDERIDEIRYDIHELNIRSIYSGHTKNLLHSLYNKRFKRKQDLFNTPNIVGNLKKMGTLVKKVPNFTNENPNIDMMNLVLLINSIRLLSHRVGF